MFCPNCGAQMPDGSTFCSNCGSPVGGQQPAMQQQQPKKSGGIDKRILIAGGAGVAVIAVVVIVVVAVLIFGKGYSSPEKAARAYANAALSNDVDDMLDTYPEFVIEQMKKYYDVDSASEMARKMKDSMETKTKSYTLGKIEADEDTITARDKIETKLKNWGWQVSDDEMKNISEYCEVYVVYASEGDTGAVTVRCIKYGRRWYVIPSESYYVSSGDSYGGNYDDYGYGFDYDDYYDYFNPYN